MATKRRPSRLQQIRQALADYMQAEGCSCCRNHEAHAASKAILAKLLKVPGYRDGFGYNFNKFKSK